LETVASYVDVAVKCFRADSRVRMWRFSDVSGTDCLFRKATTNHSYSQENWQLMYIIISLNLLKFSFRLLPTSTN